MAWDGVLSKEGEPVEVEHGAGSMGDGEAVLSLDKEAKKKYFLVTPVICYPRTEQHQQENIIQYLSSTAIYI